MVKLLLKVYLNPKVCRIISCLLGQFGGLGLLLSYLGKVSGRMENQMEQKMEHELETIGPFAGH